MEPDRYVLGVNAAEQERLQRQNKAMKREAEWLLDRIGLQPGRRAIDVGCGPIGILDSLASRVGPDGSVVGLDISEEFAAQAREFVSSSPYRNVEIVVGDARASGLPRRSFDFVHERFVLVNIPRPQEVLEEMVALVAPGGIVAAEETDSCSFICEPMIPAWTRLFDAIKEVWARHGATGSIGKYLPAMLRSAGLVDVEVEVHARTLGLDHPWRYLVLGITDLVRAQAIEAGLLREGEVDDLKAQVRAHVEDPKTVVVSPLIFQTWARVA